MTVAKLNPLCPVLEISRQRGWREFPNYLNLMSFLVGTANSGLHQFTSKASLVQKQKPITMVLRFQLMM
jgi:ABC-type polysaccharide/polyol phosphate export permease